MTMSWAPHSRCEGSPHRCRASGDRVLLSQKTLSSRFHRGVSDRPDETGQFARHRHHRHLRRLASLHQLPKLPIQTFLRLLRHALDIIGTSDDVFPTAVFRAVGAIAPSSSSSILPDMCVALFRQPEASHPLPVLSFTDAKPRVSQSAWRFRTDRILAPRPPRSPRSRCRFLEARTDR